MINIINAEDAKNLTKTKLEEANKLLVEDVNSKIREACQNGQYKAYYYEHLSVELIESLKKLGYEVSFNSARNETMYTISW